MSVRPMSTRMLIRTGAVVLALTGFAVEPAHAGGYDNLSCAGSPYFFSCVRRWDIFPPERLVPDPQEQAEAAERERRWLARCRPVVKQDQFGVGRYRYAAPGCEFGRSQD